ncbi:hypothetical protein [Neptunomonas phycophila]|uniref:hypothetical protein n=1 Tax=Neptunomonas phycophila TaxID=1572645 RepID=UPI0035149401
MDNITQQNLETLREKVKLYKAVVDGADAKIEVLNSIIHEQDAKLHDLMMENKTLREELKGAGSCTLD